MNNIKECDNCKYYEDGVCCNGDSEYCADFVGFGQCCNEYEENERLTFKTELGISIDKNEDCPTMSICWNCDIPPRKCNYFNDAIEKLAKYEEIGTVEEFKVLKEKLKENEDDGK